MLAETLAALARLLLGGTPFGEANRALLQLRCDAGDWIEGNEERIREMVTPALRS